MLSDSHYFIVRIDQLFSDEMQETQEICSYFRRDLRI